VNLSLLPRQAFETFRDWVTDRRFELVIWDSMTQHLAAADVDGARSNSEVAWWITELVNPVERYGGTTICVDHVRKAGASGGYALGPTVKKGRARIVYEFEKKTAVDRHTAGRVVITCEKNTDAAEVPHTREVMLGGTPSCSATSRCRRRANGKSGRRCERCTSPGCSQPSITMRRRMELALRSASRSGLISPPEIGRSYAKSLAS
jgi:hypothetical protein